jgi:hypothetical protein
VWPSFVESKGSFSSPQKEGRLTGAGVTGKLGRSTSVGKSVTLKALGICKAPSDIAELEEAAARPVFI